MTRKTYELFAEVLASQRAVNADNPIAVHAVDGVTKSLTDIFAQDNPRFDRDRFYRAAGIDW